MKKVIVIGLGIVGAVTSYQLARRNMKVIMIDSEELGRSTFAAAGMVNPWTTKRRNKAWYKLATLGAKWYDVLMQQLHEDSFTNCGYEKVGALHLHNDETKLQEFITAITERQKTEPAMGNIEVLNEEETFNLFPYIKKEYKSVYISGVGRVDGELLTKTLMNGAKKYGATHITGKAELIVEQDEVRGVKVNEESIYADAVIMTNGIWMPELLTKIAIDMPLTVRKGENIHLQTNEQTDSLPIVIPPSNKYILPFTNGKIIVGTTFKRVSFAERIKEPQANGIYEILHETLQVAPKFAEAKITDIRTGFRPYTANSLPLFGPIPNVKNLYGGNGLGASGLSTGPMIGLQLAKLLNNEPLDVNIEDYSFNKIIEIT